MTNGAKAATGAATTGAATTDGPATGASQTTVRPLVKTTAGQMIDARACVDKAPVGKDLGARSNTASTANG